MTAAPRLKGSVALSAPQDRVARTMPRPAYNAIPMLAASVIAAMFLVSREPAHLIHPELWAEDGRVWLQEANAYGLISLFWPRGGYLQTLSRLGALCAQAMPLTLVPRFFACLSLSVQMLPAIILLSGRARALIPSILVRIILVAYYIGEPNSSEVYLNLTNAMWHLAVAAFLIITLPKPAARFAGAADAALLVLAGISGPLGIFLVPIAWWHCLTIPSTPRKTERRGAMAYALIVTSCALLQLACLCLNAGSQRMGNLDANYNRFVHILANQLFLGGSIGAANVYWLLHYRFWARAAPATVVCLAGGYIMVCALREGPAICRQFMVFAVLIMASALKFPLVSLAGQWFQMQNPGAGDRYFVIPMLAWFASLVVVAAMKPTGWNPSRWFARLILLSVCFGVVADWSYPPLSPTGFDRLAQEFDKSPSGAKITFPEDPASWEFTLIKK